MCCSDSHLDCPGLHVTALSIDPDAVTVHAEPSAAAAACPDCGRASDRVHSRYARRLTDLPVQGRRLVLRLTTRRFYCRRQDCHRRIFCERLPGVAAAHARTTGPLAESHRDIGFALGGEAGARLARKLAVPTSPDTLLRRVKSAPDRPAPPPRYVGVDDWATRKGHAYGTILIDLERGTVIDLFPGRDGGALEAWLAANPQVEVITRDRWPAYIRAGSAAAPQAKQVADRFHLLTDVREAVEKVLSRVGPDIRAASAAADAAPAEPTATPAPAPVPGTATPTTVPSTAKEQRRAGKRGAREERFRRVKELTAEGRSVRQIAARLRMSRGAVLRYQRSDRCPDWRPGRTGPTAVDPYAGFIADWVAAGQRNSADLYRLLKGKGFAGGYDAARRYLNRLVGSSGRPGRRDATAAPGPAGRPPPSARKLSFRVVNPKPDSHSDRVLAALRGRNPAVHAAVGLAEELVDMIRQRKETPLAEWSAKATASGDPDSRNLAASLLTDAAAVQAALTKPWSNGPVEGQVNRLKAIKRQMYGRAGMGLLRARVRRKG